MHQKWKLTPKSGWLLCTSDVGHVPLRKALDTFAKWHWAIVDDYHGNITFRWSRTSNSTFSFQSHGICACFLCRILVRRLNNLFITNDNFSSQLLRPITDTCSAHRASMYSYETTIWHICKQKIHFCEHICKQKNTFSHGYCTSTNSRHVSLDTCLMRIIYVNTHLLSSSCLRVILSYPF